MFKSIIAALFAGRFGAFANANVTIEQLQAKLADLKSEAEAIQAVADAEKRDLTPQESEKVEALFAAFDATEIDIKRREKMAQMGSRVNGPGVRKTAPDGASMTVRDGARIEGGEPAAYVTSKGTGGFRSYGDYAIAVKQASAGRPPDPRLLAINAAAPTTQQQEGVGGDGGYLVPPDYRTSILTKVFGEESLLSRCDQQSTSSNSITFPADEAEPWASTGVVAAWEGEAQLLNQSKAALKAVSVRANKITCLVPVTDEQLEDGPSLEAFLRKKASDKIMFKVNDAIMNGDGVGKPLGVLKAAALITQAAEGGQTAGTVVANNILKMWSRMNAGNRRNAVWVINQDLEAQLPGITLPNPGGGVAAPAYLPPGGLSGAQYGTIMGRPVVVSETANTVGQVGDIGLYDFSQYLALIKGGLKQDASIHLWFDYGLTAFRFTLRIGGQPWWAGVINRPKGNSVSCFVTLAAR